MTARWPWGIGLDKRQARRLRRSMSATEERRRALAPIVQAMRVPSFHNSCRIAARSSFAHWCEDHGVRVYRDGVDWCTLPGPRG